MLSTTIGSSYSFGLLNPFKSSCGFGPNVVIVSPILNDPMFDPGTRYTFEKASVKKSGTTFNVKKSLQKRSIGRENMFAFIYSLVLYSSFISYNECSIGYH